MLPALTADAPSGRELYMTPHSTHDGSQRKSHAAALPSGNLADTCAQGLSVDDANSVHSPPAAGKNDPQLSADQTKGNTDAPQGKNDGSVVAEQPPTEAPKLSQNEAPMPTPSTFQKALG